MIEPTFSQTLKDIVAQLERFDIPFMVTGSVAGAGLGNPRATRDIDMVIDPTEESLHEFIGSLDRDRYYEGGSEDALAARSTFNIVDQKTGWKVDLIFRKDTPFANNQMYRMKKTALGGVSIPVISVEDLILAKLDWSADSQSEVQRRDVATLLAIHKDALDLEYLNSWAKELGVYETLVDLMDSNH